MLDVNVVEECEESKEGAARWSESIKSIRVSRNRISVTSSWRNCLEWRHACVMTQLSCCSLKWRAMMRVRFRDSTSCFLSRVSGEMCGYKALVVKSVPSSLPCGPFARDRNMCEPLLLVVFKSRVVLTYKTIFRRMGWGGQESVRWWLVTLHPGVFVTLRLLAESRGEFIIQPDWCFLCKCFL
jgi:hypothetical protein